MEKFWCHLANRNSRYGTLKVSFTVGLSQNLSRKNQGRPFGVTGAEGAAKLAMAISAKVFGLWRRSGGMVATPPIQGCPTGPPWPTCDTKRAPRIFPGEVLWESYSKENLQTPKSRVPVGQMAPKFFHMLLGTTLRSPENFSWIRLL